jgi:hypothetical protein
MPTLFTKAVDCGDFEHWQHNQNKQKMGGMVSVFLNDIGLAQPGFKFKR